MDPGVGLLVQQLQLSLRASLSGDQHFNQRARLPHLESRRRPLHLRRIRVGFEDRAVQVAHQLRPLAREPFQTCRVRHVTRCFRIVSPTQGWTPPRRAPG